MCILKAPQTNWPRLCMVSKSKVYVNYVSVAEESKPWGITGGIFQRAILTEIKQLHPSQPFRSSKPEQMILLTMSTPYHWQNEWAGSGKWQRETGPKCVDCEQKEQDITNRKKPIGKSSYHASYPRKRISDSCRTTSGTPPFFSKSLTNATLTCTYRYLGTPLTSGQVQAPASDR